jgi:outer membrane protein assembly factor BamB
MTGLFCYDFKGNLVWTKDLGTYEADSGWGTSTSPLLYQNKLYLQIDNEESSFLVALDTKTGDEIWRVPREDSTNYSTPVIWKNRVRTELVTGGQTARSYEPATGGLIWELHLGGGRNIASPVANEDLLFIGNEQRLGGGGFLFAVKAGAEGDITPAPGESTSSGILWTTPDAGISMSSPLLYKGYIYLVERRRGAIFCYEEATGRRLYGDIRIPGAGPFWASPWAYDDKIWCLDERGITHVIKPGEEFEVLWTNSIDDKFWSTTAITKKGYVFRGVNNLYLVD